MNNILENFIKMSELVSNLNEIVNTEEIEKIVIQGRYDYINLKFSDAFNKLIEVGKEGIGRALVEADLAIAETGSVVLKDSSEQFRRATCLCEDLHVIVPMSKIVKGLDEVTDFMKEVTSQREGRYVVFITGASRTADIEMSLTLGVHGPKSMQVFIIKDL